MILLNKILFSNHLYHSIRRSTLYSLKKKGISSIPSINKSENVFIRTSKCYIQWLETHQWKVKILTSATIAGLGDASCQLFIEKTSIPFDWKRFGMFTAIGGFYIAPLLHLWYKFLGRYVSGNTTKAIMTRLAIDQFIFAPTFLPIFFSVLLTLEGKQKDISLKIKNEWWITIKNNWIVWIPAQYINFRHIQPNLQVLFANVIGLFWNMYLSHVSHKNEHITYDKTA